MTQTLHFRASSKEELRAILDILKARGFNNTDGYRASNAIAQTASGPEGVIIHAYTDKSLGWDGGSRRGMLKVIEVRNIAEVIRALDGEPGIQLRSSTGALYEVKFRDSGSVEVGCVLVTSEQFMAIAKRRAEVMKAV